MKKILAVLLSMLICILSVNIAFANDGGNYTLEFESGLNSSEIIVNAAYNPNNEEVVSFTGILALYNGRDKLLDVEILESQNNTARISIANRKDAEKAKAFIWESEDKPIPLADMVEINKGTVIGPESLVDFVVDVETGREPVILQLTDTQVTDAYGATETVDDALERRCFKYLRETIEATSPDLILLTGDLVYGRFDNEGTLLKKLISAMDSFEIPWAPVFGNHENESAMGADWQCEQLENAQYCLFKQRTLTGNGNYSVGITQGGKLKRVLFMLDSNGCGQMSAATIANGHSTTTKGFGADQIAWYTDVATKINRLAPNMKYSFVYHIQQEIFRNALSQYGTIDSTTAANPINIDTSTKKASTDFGYIGSDLKGSWDTNFEVYNGMKALGADSHFVGHEHLNSASVMYDGTRFQYGQKSSTYDRANYLKEDGTIEGSYSTVGTPIMGGTVMKMSETDGSFTDCYIYYCGGVKTDTIVVPGMKLESELTLSGDSISGRAVTIDNVNAYQFTASAQSEVYVNPTAIANQDVFTFDAYVPSTSNNKLNGKGEFSIRIEPSELEPQTDGTADGYIDFNSSAVVDDVKVVYDEWKTYSIDISDFGTNCTEFAFVIPAGNTIYLKNMAVDIKVPGLSFDDGDLTPRTTYLVITTDRAGGKSAYAVKANAQDRFYVNTELLKNKSTFSFSVYLPEESVAKVSGGGEFVMRVKPNNLEPQIDSSTNGHIAYDSAATVDDLKLVHGEWKTYSIDISGFGTDCTEFAFIIAAGNTIYVRDLEVK